jgi:hypothetical protein
VIPSSCGLFEAFSGFFGLVQAHKLNVKSLMRAPPHAAKSEGFSARLPGSMQQVRSMPNDEGADGACAKILEWNEHMAPGRKSTHWPSGAGSRLGLVLESAPIPAYGMFDFFSLGNRVLIRKLMHQATNGD